jgi:hypothetical protein
LTMIPKDIYYLDPVFVVELDGCLRFRAGLHPDL